LFAIAFVVFLKTARKLKIAAQSYHLPSILPILIDMGNTELRNAVSNMDTSNEIKRKQTYISIYDMLLKKDLRCFDKKGFVHNSDGEVIINKCIEMFTYTKEEGKTFYLYNLLALFQEKFRGKSVNDDAPENASHTFIPFPKHLSDC